MAYPKLSQSICQKPDKRMRHLTKTKLAWNYHQPDQTLTTRLPKDIWERGISLKRTVFFKLWLRGKTLVTEQQSKWDLHRHTSPHWCFGFYLDLMKQPPCQRCSLHHSVRWWCSKKGPTPPVGLCDLVGGFSPAYGQQVVEGHMHADGARAPAAIPEGVGK